MFPQIAHIDDLLPHIQHNQQIRAKVESTGHTVVSYMVQDEDTFAGTDLQFAVECRGITFHPDGKIAGRCLHKFFNVGEHESVQPHNISWGKVDRIMEKRDGSMVTPVMLPSGANWKMKTKKTFGSPEAALADDLGSLDGRHHWICNLLRADLTPTFEVTSPKFPIVLKYDKDELTLLHIRENVSGRYLTEREITFLNPPFPVVKNLKMQFCPPGLPANLVSWDILKTMQETMEGLEGWVVQFEDGDMVKVKTKWYMDLHHAVTFTRWRDIARTVAADQSDDLKGAFAMTGRSIEPILKVEREIKESIAEPKAYVELMAADGHLDKCTPKEMAERHKGHELFGQIMRTFRGGEVDWMDWYAKNHLDNDWSLEVVEINV
jgi:RNA ligase